MAVVGSINRRQSVGACIPILVSWYESEEDGMGKHLQPSLLKKEEDDMNTRILLYTEYTVQ